MSAVVRVNTNEELSEGMWIASDIFVGGGTVGGDPLECVAIMKI